MLVDSRTYRITLIEPMLGSQPDPDVYERHMVEKARKEAKKAGIAPEVIDEHIREETDKLVDTEAGRTRFHQDAEGVYLFDYQFKGFLKAAGETLAKTFKGRGKGGVERDGIWAIRGKMDRHVFVGPRIIRLADRPSGYLSRPLRAETMQGPRVSLASSEMVPAGLSFDVSIYLIPGSEITWAMIDEMLEYGRWSGLGQWRNGGYGRFECQRVDAAAGGKAAA